MQKRWHYIYVIVYPALGYKLYYGSRITDKHPDDDYAYFGSSRTFARYNAQTHKEFQASALKVVLYAEHCAWTKTSASRLSKKEAQIIKLALSEQGAEMCLNRNISGRFMLTSAELSAAGKKAVTLGLGAHGMHPDKAYQARSLGGRANGVKSAKTYFMLSPDNKFKMIHNMTSFCKKHGLPDPPMFKVANGLKKSYRGWRKA